MKITIIGAGNTAVAAACFLKILGLSSLIYTRREERAKQWNQFPVKASGACTGSFSLESTTDLKTAVHYGDILLVCTLAADHETVISEIAPHLQAHQSILFFNGCWGALKAYRALSKRQDMPPLTIGETANMPFIAALSQDGSEILIKGIKEEIAYSAAGDDKAVSAFLHRLAPRVVKTASFASTSLSATNPVIHVTASLFNVTRIENKEDFYFFGDPMTDRVISFMEHCDEERLAVGKALGIRLSPLLEVLNSFWPEKKNTLKEVLKENPSYRAVKGPSSTEYRYFTEDLPCGLGPVLDLAELMHIPCPYIRTLVQTASLYLGKPYTPFLTKEDLRILKKLHAD